ncbi:MAG: cytochrome c peroxidase [bacterium]
MNNLKASATAVAAGLLVVLAGCIDQATSSSPVAPAASLLEASSSIVITPDSVRKLAASRGVFAMPVPPHVRPALVHLGQMLAFDPILSGNRNIACMTCHLASLGTGDGRSLSIGEGGTDFGPSRTHARGVFIPRNAPPLFNLGAMRHLFWDGRVEVDDRGRMHTPAGSAVTPAMEGAFEFGPVSAIGMFPVTNRAEMRGRLGKEVATNELAPIGDEDFAGIWSAIMRRLGAIPEYRTMFAAAYPGERFEDMTFAHASNAIGGFLVDQLTFANSPWDRFLAGDGRALTQRQLDGAGTFLTLKCSLCHVGSTFSDEKFHDVAVAQIGPGEGDGGSARDDFGRMRVTGATADRYLFRTTPLRNVELTGPYGHDGAIASLRAFVDHYSESDKKLLAFDPTSLEPSLRLTMLPTTLDILAQRDTIIRGVVLTPALVDKLMDYMLALTDPASRNLSHIVPPQVPSKLPMAPSLP